MQKTEWGIMVRKSAFTDSNIPASVVDRFERENPAEVVKMNPLARNSPKLYNREAFDRWWEKCCQLQHMAVRRGVM